MHSRTKWQWGHQLNKDINVMRKDENPLPAMGAFIIVGTKSWCIVPCLFSMLVCRNGTYNKLERIRNHTTLPLLDAWRLNGTT